MGKYVFAQYGMGDDAPNVMVVPTPNAAPIAPLPNGLPLNLPKSATPGVVRLSSVAKMAPSAATSLASQFAAGKTFSSTLQATPPAGWSVVSSAGAPRVYTYTYGMQAAAQPPKASSPPPIPGTTTQALATPNGVPPNMPAYDVSSSAAPQIVDSIPSTAVPVGPNANLPSSTPPAPGTPDSVTTTTPTPDIQSTATLPQSTPSSSGSGTNLLMLGAIGLGLYFLAKRA